jgi:hypothetical protein
MGKVSVLERFRQSGLFENALGAVPGFDLVIDRESTIVHRALSDFVVAFPWRSIRQPAFLGSSRTEGP